MNDIIKRGVIKVKRYERPSNIDVSGHSLRISAAQDLLTEGYDSAAIIPRAAGQARLGLEVFKDFAA